jgi:hypothetical protein
MEHGVGERTPSESLRNGMILVAVLALISLGIGALLDSLLDDAADAVETSRPGSGGGSFDDVASRACAIEARTLATAEEAAFAQSGTYYDLQGLAGQQWIEGDVTSASHAISLLGPSGLATDYKVIGVDECFGSFSGGAMGTYTEGATVAACGIERDTVGTAIQVSSMDDGHWWEYLDQAPQYHVVTPEGQILSLGYC